MRFKVDENLHPDVSALLVAEGHEAHTVAEEGLRGCGDAELLEHCRQESRVLVTLDVDFGDVRRYPPRDNAGIIVLRLHSQARRQVLNVVARTAEILRSEAIGGRLWIVSEAAIRIREG